MAATRADIAVPRKFQAHLYLTEGPREDAERLSKSVADFLNVFGYEFDNRWRIRQGSWIAEADVQLAGEAEPDSLRAQSEQVLATLAGRGTGSPGRAARQAGLMLQTLEGMKGMAALDCGSLLFIKCDDAEGRPQLTGRLLSEDDRRRLDAEPALRTDPEALLRLGYDAKLKPENALLHGRAPGTGAAARVVDEPSPFSKNG